MVNQKYDIFEFDSIKRNNWNWICTKWRLWEMEKEWSVMNSLKKMSTWTRTFMVNGRTKISQMDKLLPRGVHESLTTTMAMTITIIPSPLLPLPLRYFRFSSAVFASFNLTRLSPPFCTLNTTTDFFYRSFLKAPDSLFLCVHHGKESARYPSLFVSFIFRFAWVFFFSEVWTEWFVLFWFFSWKRRGGQEGSAARSTWWQSCRGLFKS